MNKQKESTNNEIGALAEGAHARMGATADSAGEKISEAKKHIITALDRGKEIAGDVRLKAVKSAKVFDQKFRENPYQAVAIGVGVGVLIGYFAASRRSHKGD